MNTRPKSNNHSGDIEIISGVPKVKTGLKPKAATVELYVPGVSASAMIYQFGPSVSEYGNASDADEGTVLDL